MLVRRSSWIRIAWIRIAVGLVLGGMAGSAFGFEIAIHRGITREALVSGGVSEPYRVVVDGVTLGFTERALEQIQDANEAMDLGPSMGLFRPERHFLSGSHQQASERLISLRQEIVEALAAGRGHEARKKLGWALHAVQDFYSHSNWIESGHSTPRLTLYGADAQSPPALNESPCPMDPSRLGPSGGGELTLAYFVGDSLFGCPVLGAGLCQHGNWQISGCPGINKDLNAELAAEWPDVEASPYHLKARQVALDATIDFVSTLVEEIREQTDEDLETLALFFGAAALGFVVDATGSMTADILRVAEVVREAVEGSLSGRVGPGTDFPLYYLKTYQDPFRSSPGLLTGSLDEFLDALTSVEVGSGEDCPEPVLSALLEALDQVPQGSELGVLTDARASDWNRQEVVGSAAFFHGAKITFFVFDPSPCPESSLGGTIPREYRELADATGGSAFRIPDPANATDSNATDFNGPAKADGSLSDLITAARGGLLTVRSGAAGSEPLVAEVPVDSTIHELTITSSSDLGAPALAIFDPSGQPVASGFPGYRQIVTATAAVALIENPRVGAWRVEARGGDGPRRLRVESDSPIELLRFDLVEESDGLHGGYEALHGAPPAGRSVIGDARLLGGPVSDLVFSAVDETGGSLGAIPLEPPAGSGSVGARHVGSFPMPDRPFRLAVRGKTGSGEIFERMVGRTLEPSTLEIVPDPEILRVSPGESYPISFLLIPHGEGGTFRLRFGGTGGLRSDLFYYDVELEPNCPERFEYTLRVPRDVVPGTEARLWLNASTEADEPAGIGRVDVSIEQPGTLFCGDPAQLCLHGGAFRVGVSWRDFEGRTGRATAAVQSEDSGAFSFFDPANWELMIKVLDGCGINGHFWVFAGAATNIEYTIEVTPSDGASKIYTNPLGSSAVPTLDTEAIACP